MPVGGYFISFFRPGGRSLALKSCLRGGDLDGKNNGPEVSPGVGGGGGEGDGYRSK